MQVLIAQSVIAVQFNRLYVIKDIVFKSPFFPVCFVEQKSITFELCKHNMIFNFCPFCVDGFPPQIIINKSTLILPLLYNLSEYFQLPLLSDDNLTISNAFLISADLTV